MSELEGKLTQCQLLCDRDPSTENINRLKIIETEYDLWYEHMAKGAIIRSRANWYEQGEKSNKYFLNLEKSRGNKSTRRKIFTRTQSVSTNPKVIRQDLHDFYSSLYQRNPSQCSNNSLDKFLESVSEPNLTEEQKEKMTIGECFNTLKTFQNNKTPGNDDLTEEFYQTFWPILGKHLVECFIYAYEHGKLSNSQKQAVITLLEKKGKDKKFMKNWRPISLINVDTKTASKTLAE